MRKTLNPLVVMPLVIIASALSVAAQTDLGGSAPVKTQLVPTNSSSALPTEAARTQAVMNEEGIVPDESAVQNGGDKREFKGKKGDLDVTFELERKSSNTTRVEASARKNLAEWDKEYAQQLVSKIVEKS